MKVHWGWAIAGVYAIFATATAGFALYAMDQRVELVSEDYYARALSQDRRMAAIANATALGQALRIDVAADGGAVTIRWPAAVRPDAGGTLILYRASEAAADRVIPVAPDAQHRQVIPLTGLRAGRWQVQLQWRSHGRDFYVERPVVTR